MFIWPAEAQRRWRVARLSPQGRWRESGRQDFAHAYIHVQFEFGGTFVCAAGRRSLGACVWSEEKHSVDEQGEWSLVEGGALHQRQGKRHLERRRLEQVSRKVSRLDGQNVRDGDRGRTAKNNASAIAY